MHNMVFDSKCQKLHNKIWIQKIDVYLFFLIPFTFFCDLFYGLFNYIGIKTSFSPGIFIRGIITILGFLIIFKRFDKRNFFYIIVIFSMLISLALGIIKNFSLYGFFLDFRLFFKSLYGFMILNIFFYLDRKYNIILGNLLNIIVVTGILLSSFVIFPYLFGFGFSTYGNYTYGFKGLIIANNDLSLSLIISFLVSLFVLGCNFNIFNFIKVIYIICGLMLIGTRAALFSLLIVPLSIFFVYIFAKSNVLVFPYINIRKKISTILIYFLCLVGFFGIFFSVFSKIMQDNYQKQKLEVILNGKLPRFILMECGFSYLKTRPFYFNLFGEGMCSYGKGVYDFYPGYSKKELKWVEVDWLDIFGGYGIIGVALFYGFYVFWFINFLKNFILKRFLFYGIVAVSLAIYIGHSALAGHAIMSPMPTSLVVLLIFAGIIFKYKHVDYNHYRYRS